MQADDALSFRLLRRLADFVYCYPRLVFYPQVILFVLCIFYTIEHLQFDTSRNDLVGARKKYHQNFLRFRDEFPGQDDLVAVVESEDLEKNRQFVERLGARLEAETNVFTDVLFNNDLKLLGRKALLFLDHTNLVDLQQTLKEYRPFIQHFSNATNLDTLFRLVNRQFRTARQEQSPENEALLKAVPALQRIIEQATDSLLRPGTPPAPGLTALFGGGAEAEEAQYITFNGGRIFLCTAHARTEELNAEAVQRLRALVRQTQAEVPGVNVGITGEPVLELDEMLQSQHDTTVASIVSLILVGFIFIYAYRETGRPIKATACLVVGLGYTMGYATLVIGHLNILTITFVPMLIGLAIDFGVHLISRYEEELRHGQDERQAITTAMVWTGKGICTGCFTTAAAFFAMALTDFKGIQEMGVISGGGMLICLVPMMTLLPVLLLRGRQNVLDHEAAQESTRAQIEQLWLKRPGLVVGLTTALCLGSGLQFSKVYFDYNLLNMQSPGLHAVVYERKLIDSAQKSVLFGAVIADSLPQAV
ncbi:MAG: MMPL family transporter, partial [Verrucomicrobia bacterium]|nr:MMPL family transporter [Verrucomicrobiota bacterium]